MLDAFSQHLQSHALAERDDHLGNGGVVTVKKNVPDKRAVDLQLIQRESLQV